MVHRVACTWATWWQTTSVRGTLYNFRLTSRVQASPLTDCRACTWACKDRAFLFQVSQCKCLFPFPFPFASAFAFLHFCIFSFPFLRPLPSSFPCLRTVSIRLTRLPSLSSFLGMHCTAFRAPCDLFLRLVLYSQQMNSYFACQ